MSQTRNKAQVAIVTGGGRGIGRAIAVDLARQGWDVCISYKANATGAQETAELVRKAGCRSLTVKADVASQQEVRLLFEETKSAFGQLDALVNNAGIVGGQREIFATDEGQLRIVFDTNVLGSFYCASEASDAMSLQRGGRGGSIVNISSAAARTGGLPFEAHYAASKGAIDSFTLALAKELGPHGIRVNAVRPGLIDTDIHLAHGGRETLTRLAPTVPLGRIGTPDEVAQVVSFLCSPLSSYVNGAIVDVSGGR